MILILSRKFISVHKYILGRFRFQFGECGKRDGQLLYPNRVAVFRQSGDIVVTERSPTHQIQIYNQYGQFIRKFGANVLQHPRGMKMILIKYFFFFKTYFLMFSRCLC